MENKHFLVRIPSGFPCYIYAHISLFRKLYGIADDIDQNLLDSAIISFVTAGNRFVTFIFQDQPPLGSSHIHHSYNFIRHNLYVIVYIHQLHFARFYFGQIQNIVDNGQQTFCRGLHILGMGIDFSVSAFLHDNIIQPDDSIHRSPYLMGHIGKEFAFRDTRLLRLMPHPLDFINISLRICHIQNQNNAALYLAAFIYDSLVMAFVMLLINRKTLGGILIQHFLPEIFHYPDILSQPMGRQTGKNLRSRTIIADQPFMIVQHDHPVAQALQNFCCRQMAEIIITAAPDHNNH